MADKLGTIKLAQIRPSMSGEFERIADEFLPHLHLNSEQVPEVHVWEVGEVYRMVIDIRQDSKDFDKPTGKTMAGFKIVGYKALRIKSIDEMSDEEFAVHQDQELEKATMTERSDVANSLDGLR